MKILSIFGTRPEAIKMAPVVNALRRAHGVESLVCVTGQHREMLDPVLELFGIAPDFDLDLMVKGQSLNGMLGRMVTALDPVLEEACPDRALVHGDTTTGMAAALCAFHRKIPVAHIEAGLRTYDLEQPWPEEMNRRVVDVVADLLFAPTAMSKRNLRSERIAGRIVVTGNTVIDALEETVTALKERPALGLDLDRRLPALCGTKKLLLVTGHRRENFGEGFAKICAALVELSDRDDLEIVYPVHLNPNVRGPVLEALGGRQNIHLIAPQDYLPFVRLMQRADVILTDSGGVQEEAPALGKPVLVMRDVTERPEAIAAGTAVLVGTDPVCIVAKVADLLGGAGPRGEFARCRNPYGDGKAASRIVATLLGEAVKEFAGETGAEPVVRQVA